MGGFFGVASKRDCVLELFYGVDYHSIWEPDGAVWRPTARKGSTARSTILKILRSVPSLTMTWRK